MTSEKSKSLSGPRFVNLLVPGGGLILVGNGVSGVMIAVLFTLSAGFALTAACLFPDDVPPTWRGLSIGIAIGTYFGAQLRFAQTVRLQADDAFWDVRRETMKTARRALIEGRCEDAWSAVKTLLDDVETDLPLAFLAAQVLTLKGDGHAALAAWRRVRRLDRHRIYRRETRENELRLTLQLDMSTRPPASDRRSS